ncbi:MAG: response regulator [Candidatus Wallbacteria bacterium]|nr:response regulator [Candidatus Wallbacteria bacterium]
MDDEEDAVNLFKLWCARWGYEALGQTEPKKALETAIAFAPDVLFLDVLMPGFDGFQVLEAIKSDARTRHVPVVMLTGGAIQVPDKVRGLAGGAVDYLTKPIDSREMRARIETYLTLRGDVLAHGRERELRAIRQTAVFLNHSINNLLAGIQAAATLHFEDGDEEAKEREALISENVRAIAGIVQRLREIKHVIGTSYAGLDGELMLDLDRSTKG